MRKVLGYSLLASPIIGALCLILAIGGIQAFIFVFGFTATVVAVVAAGAYLVGTA